MAERYLGVRYEYGGESPSGFDCSGLVQYAYASVGIAIPRTTYSQYKVGTPVSRSELEPGDLLFFDHVGHVGIYVGGGRFIHAPHTGTVVQFGSLTGWYSRTTWARAGLRDLDVREHAQRLVPRDAAVEVVRPHRKGYPEAHPTATLDAFGGVIEVTWFSHIKVMFGRHS